MFEILSKPICYVTLEVNDSLLQCSGCRCAWYSSKDHQQEHWSVHKRVCKIPEIRMIEQMTAQQCFDALCGGDSSNITALPWDHNTAAIFVRLYYIMRTTDPETGICDSIFGEKSVARDLAVTLQALARTSLPESYHKRAWACPGLPQLLFFTDLRSNLIFERMQDNPQGLPVELFKESDSYKKDYKSDTEADDSGESLAFFVISFLVRSSIAGELGYSSIQDGVTTIGRTQVAAGARLRIAQILSTPSLRDSAINALAPVPGLLLNIAENLPEEFIKFLDMGIFKAILQLAARNEQYSEFAVKTMNIVASLDPALLADDTKLDILETCLGPIKYYTSFMGPGISKPDKQIPTVCNKVAINILLHEPDLTTFLERGMARRSEIVTPSWDIDTAFGEQRAALAFLLEKLVLSMHGGTVNGRSLKGCLREWKKLSSGEKSKFRMQVMDREQV